MHERIDVLLVEDDAGDRLMTEEAFADGRVAARLHMVADGVEALDFLRRRKGFTQVPTADLVLLDLNLPRKGGHEVLAEIRADEELTHLPVVVFTTSAAPDDVMASYRLHASAFVTKPTNYEGYVEVLKQIDQFYTGVATLP